MTPLQASVLLNEAIELLVNGSPNHHSDWETMKAAEARLVSFRDGFFRHIRTKNNHPVKVPAVPRDSRYVSSYTGMLTRDLDDRDS